MQGKMTLIFGKRHCVNETKENRQALDQFLSKSYENGVEGKHCVLVETPEGVQYQRNVTHRRKAAL